MTTLSVEGGGPLTSRLAEGLWQAALWSHRWRSNHALLATMGWLVLVVVALTWLLLTWAGWVCFFGAFDGAIANSQSKAPASLWDLIYFTGYTISTLGLGDFQPTAHVWEIATAIASANGFLLVTLAIAYLLPVVSAVAQQRQLAIYISSLGGTPDEILTHAWNGQNFGQLYQHLIAITPQLALQGERHLAYPVLHYFHSAERSRAIALSIAALDEALTLINYGVVQDVQPDTGTVSPAHRASTAYLKTLRSAYIAAAPSPPPPPPLHLLRLAGIPTVTDGEFHARVEQVAMRRQLLLSLVEQDGWDWGAIASSKTTNRAAFLTHWEDEDQP
ncbi:MAG: ion channel [Synechococcales bacterium]|nr:ion channel [Synechococcales bacterium]